MRTAAVAGAAAADRDWQWSVRADDPWVIDVKFPEPDATSWFVVTLTRISWSHPAMHNTEGVNPSDWQRQLRCIGFWVVERTSGPTAWGGVARDLAGRTP